MNLDDFTSITITLITSKYKNNNNFLAFEIQ